MIEIQTTVSLKCNKCTTRFFFIVEVDANGIYDELHDEDRLAAGEERIRIAQERVRQLAQKVGWLHCLPLGGGEESDLCPGCFVMPPEG